MSLWNHPRLTAALCTVAVLGCAAAPAVFLAAADAASLGRVETVADPYVAPTPTADDYYILRQLAARSRNAESEREQRPAEVLTAPKMYIGASASLQSMQYADSAAAEAAENALRSFAAQAGLESLGDWAAPADSPYGCALYSTNGGALITASTHPYTYQDYVGTAPVSSDRWYYSLTLQLRTEDQLPG